MQEGRVLKTDVAEFVESGWTGENTSGFTPMSTRVMVLPDSVNSQTRGGVWLPDDKRSQMALAAESGVVVALGTEAFRYSDDGTPWRGQKPERGDTVYFERYAGQVLNGNDGRHYRVMDAKCIGAVAVKELTS